MKENCPGKESSDSQEDTSKIGNTLWCSCGKYRPMAIYAESICYLVKCEIYESYLSKVYFPHFYLFLKYFYPVIY